jgi:hypothetical protein
MRVSDILIYGILVVVLAGTVAVTGCTYMEPKPPPGPAEKAGAALDKAMDKAAGKAGEVLEKAGDALEKAGSDLRKAPVTTP